MLQINNYKYPPRLYFLCYGMAMSLICYLIVYSSSLLRKCRLFAFIGMNSIWIYLYHIPLIQITGLLGSPWYIRYIFVCILAVLLCQIQIIVVNKLQAKYKSFSFFKYFRG